jgi:hypothetical protein
MSAQVDLRRLITRASHLSRAAALAVPLTVVGPAVLSRNQRADRRPVR